MRGIRIAAFSVAAILVCVVISHLFTEEPVADGETPADGIEASQEVGGETVPTVVPAPPPRAGEPSAQPAKKRRAPEAPVPEPSEPDPPEQDAPAQEKFAQAPPAPSGQPIEEDAASVASSTSDTRPGIWQENELAADASDVAAATDAAGTAGQAQGLVIVVPQARPKEESRGSRWLRAVGRALGIGGRKDPVEQSFQQ